MNGQEMGTATASEVEIVEWLEHLLSSGNGLGGKVSFIMAREGGGQIWASEGIGRQRCFGQA